MRNKGTEKGRAFILQCIVAGIALLFVFRLFQLQIIKRDLFQTRVGYNTRQRIVEYPSRGLIYDRNNKLIVHNDPMYDLKYIYKAIDPAMDTAKFCEILEISKAEFVKRTEKDWSDYRNVKYKPMTFKKQISVDQYARLQESLYQFPGFFGELRNVRGYDTKHAAHLLGYISEATQKLVAADDNYKLGDYVGNTGVEKFYEEDLRGKKGVRYVLKNNLGQLQGSYLNGKLDTNATSGYDLKLSLDLELQEYAEQLMQNKIGSIVALEPSTGEILALVSSPTFDPALLAIGQKRNASFSKLTADKSKPFLNRAFDANYPPGSIFKPLLGLIALDEGVSHPERGVTCHGGYRYGSLRVGCHNHKYCGSLESGIANSCNAYFCQVFRDVVDKYGFKKGGEGLDTLVDKLHKFSLGNPVPTDIGISKSGLVPDSDYYDKVYPKRLGGWKSPTIISLGIGQGEFLFTPLQMAIMTSAIANRGYYYNPHVVKRINSQDVAIDEIFTNKHEVGIADRHFDPIIDGMEQVVLEGTARIAQIEGVAVCGKTGTSQNPHGKDHSAFVSFAPKTNPKIVVSAFVENGGYGSTYAAPISSLLLEKYLHDTISTKRKWIEKRMFDADLIPKDEQESN